MPSSTVYTVDSLAATRNDLLPETNSRISLCVALWEMLDFPSVRTSWPQKTLPAKDQQPSVPVSSPIMARLLTLAFYQLVWNCLKNRMRFSSSASPQVGVGAGCYTQGGNATCGNTPSFHALFGLNLILISFASYPLELWRLLIYSTPFCSSDSPNSRWLPARLRQGPFSVIPPDKSPVPPLNSNQYPKL